MTTGILLFGFLIGMSHALEADHLASIATLACKNNSIASMAKQGIAWGIGHTITLLMFAGLALALGTMIPETYASGLEMLVGVMLVILGGDVFRQMLSHQTHFHQHQHADGTQHFHGHSHNRHQPHPTQQHSHSHSSVSTKRALGIGLMHGTAGSAALVILAMDHTQGIGWGLLYILLFGVGSIAGMAILSMTIMLPMVKIQSHLLSGWYRAAQFLVAVTTCTLGVVVIWRTWTEMFG